MTTLGSSPDVSRLAPFTVGEWLVEPKACRLSRGDTVVKLRPQVMDLFVCLARRAGEIVLKDEILAEVWAAQFIAESGLSRCVAELRQHLEDDAHVPRYIETIPKRGYRLVAAVTWPTKPEGGAAGCEPATAPPTIQAGPPARPLVTLRDPAARGPAPRDPAAGVGAIDTRPRAIRRLTLTRRFLFVGGILVVVVALTITGVLSAGGWGVRPLLNERDTVLLADVTNTTGNAVFDDALRLALGVNLGQAPFLRILPREAVRGAMGRAGRSPDGRVTGAVALDVCRREGATVMLATSIAPIGSRYAVGIEAVACETGEEVWRTIEEADRKERVLDALDRAAARTRRRLGESRESLQQHNVPLVRATTPSIDALKALTLGDDSRDHGRLDDALVFYRQATELDPEFALAWARRGIAASNLGRPEQAAPAISRAYALIERVSPPERYYIAAHYQRNVQGNLEQALETYRAWTRLYPGSVVPPTNTASILVTAMGQYEAALPDAREALRLAPFSSVAAAILSLAYRGLGRVDDARAVLDEVRARGVNDRLTSSLRLELALLDGDAAAVERESRWAAGQPAAEVTAFQLRGSAAMAAGRLREARRLWADALMRAYGLGSGIRVAEARLFEARAEATAGAAAAARRAVDAALAADRSPFTLGYSAVVLALLDDRARVRALLDEADGQAANDPAVLRTWTTVARALVAARSGRPGEAEGLLQTVARVERGSEYRLVPVYARALIELSVGRPADAAATFDSLTRLRAIDPTAPWVATAQLGRARALRAAGNKAGSAAAYAAFLDAWKGADPDAPLLIAAKRERAAVAR